MNCFIEILVLSVSRLSKVLMYESSFVFSSWGVSLHSKGVKGCLNEAEIYESLGLPWLLPLRSTEKSWSWIFGWLLWIISGDTYRDYFTCFGEISPIVDPLSINYGASYLILSGVRLDALEIFYSFHKFLDDPLTGLSTFLLLINYLPDSLSLSTENPF